MDAIPQQAAVVFGVVLFLVVLGFLNNLRQGWAKRTGAVNKPMSITLYTAKSPAELNQDASNARWQRRLFVVFLLGVGYAILFVANEELALDLFELGKTIFLQLLTALGNLIDLVLNAVKE